MKPLVALNREVALELSQSIDQTLDLASCIDQSRLMKLYNVSMVACKSKCRGVKGNPTCFCSLVPQENGFKKKGLWMTEKAVLKTLGPDPEDKQRKASECMAAISSIRSPPNLNSHYISGFVLSRWTTQPRQHMLRQHGPSVPLLSLLLPPRSLHNLLPILHECGINQHRRAIKQCEAKSGR